MNAENLNATEARAKIFCSVVMKDGQIISDTPKSHSDLQSSKLSKLRLNPPQMVEFSERVKQQIWADFPVNLYTINEIQEEVHKRWHVFH